MEYAKTTTKSRRTEREVHWAHISKVYIELDKDGNQQLMIINPKYNPKKHKGTTFKYKEGRKMHKIAVIASRRARKDHVTI